MPLYNEIYITSEMLSATNVKIVESIKTSYNYTTLMTEVSSSALEFPPETGISAIDIPIFENVRTQQYSYTNVDAYSGAPEFEQSATSAYPESSIISAFNENNETVVLSELGTQECSFIAIANGIIKQLIEDNKLLYNPSQDREFKWYVQTKTSVVTFNIFEDYPYWYIDRYNEYEINSETVSVISDIVTSATAEVLSASELTETSVSDGKKVLHSDGSYYSLEKYITVPIETSVVEVSNIVGINIFATNSIDGKKYNVKDYYIEGNNVLVKVQNEYNASSQSVNFTITLQYFYN